jgi:predicted PurR-regulated permease PerM
VPAASPQLIRSVVEIAIRLGVIALLVVWCVSIVAPFLGIVVWAFIIAIATEDPFEKLCVHLGGRRAWATALFIGLALVLIFAPAVLLSETLVSAAAEFAHQVKSGTLAVPPPNPAVRDIPFVGVKIHDFWSHANANLGETLMRLEPQLRAVSRWLLTTAGSVGVGILQMIGSIVIAGVMLARRETRHGTIEQLAHRMAGPVRGPEFASLVRATVRSVVYGILGVAALQAILAGTAFAVAGIPGAGLWALLVLVAAVAQLPVVIAMAIPIVIGFSTLGGAAATALLVWCGLIGLIDNVLKPILFGRGVDVPMLVIFMGALGGMLTMGIVGLFLGAVVLALGYELFKAWLLDEGVDAVEGGDDRRSVVESRT